MPNSAQQGMKNLTGTLCYRHSLFQALLHCPKVAHWLRSFHPPQTCKFPGLPGKLSNFFLGFVDKPANCVACQFRAVIQAYWSGKPSDLTQELRTIDKVFKTSKYLPLSATLKPPDKPQMDGHLAPSAAKQTQRSNLLG